MNNIIQTFFMSPGDDDDQTYVLILSKIISYFYIAIITHEEVV